MNIQYRWALWQKSVSLKGSWLKGLRYLDALSKLKISWGFWLSLEVDHVIDSAQFASDKDVDSQALHRPIGKHDIRLLHLDRGTRNEALRGYIKTCPLFADGGRAKGPKYTALSYVWGTGDSSGMIEISGVDLVITRNLDRALRQIRHRESVEVLWIDSICINQRDINEKNRQVALMPRIYSNAQRVDVWLGDESQHSSTGMDIIRYFVTSPRPAKDALWRTLPSELALRGLADIMSRAWFGRVWVVQEAVFARQTRLICGTSTVSWATSSGVTPGFLRMIKFACILPEWRHKGLDSVEMQPLLKLLDLQLEVLLAKNTGTLRPCADVLDIAYELRDKLASDPRDMLFSIAGMVDGLWSCEDFKPDYTLSVEQSYDHLQRAVRFCHGDCPGPREHLPSCRRAWDVYQ